MIRSDLDGRPGRAERRRRRERRAHPRLERMEGRLLMTIDFTSATAIGGSGATSIQAAAVAIDNAGNSYITGTFNGSTLNQTATGTTDILVAKFDPNGTLLWTHHYGNSKGVGSSGGRGVAVDASGDVFVTGFFSGTLDFDP